MFSQFSDTLQLQTFFFYRDLPNFSDIRWTATYFFLKLAPPMKRYANTALRAPLPFSRFSWNTRECGQNDPSPLLTMANINLRPDRSPLLDEEGEGGTLENPPFYLALWVRGDKRKKKRKKLSKTHQKSDIIRGHRWSDLCIYRIFQNLPSNIGSMMLEGK